MENKKLTCIVCPMGCQLNIEIDNGEVISVSGNACKRGIVYANSEVKNPVRIITTTMYTNEKCPRLIPVKSDNPIPKSLVFDCLNIIKKNHIPIPFDIGSIVIENIMDTGSNIVATSKL